MYKLRDIFDFEEDETKDNRKDNIQESEDSQLERMKELNKTYQQRGKFIKEDNNKKIDKTKLKEEAQRLKKLSGHRLIKEYGNDGIPLQGMNFPGHGETVTTFMPTRGTQNATSYIKPEEALDISIKRAIESGTPVNNMGFYDEVNWHLNNLGFESKLPIDIKNSLIKVIGGDNVNVSVDE